MKLRRRSFLGLAAALSAVSYPTQIDAAVRILRGGIAPLITGSITAEGGTTSGATLSGFAPFTAYFSAIGVTSSRLHNSFTDMDCQWNFGDPGSGTWQQGARAGIASRNEEVGQFVAHVYRTPGTYTATVRFFDGVEYSAPQTVTVTVYDPEAVDQTIYDGGRTLLVSSTGDFTCAGLKGTPATLNTGSSSTALDQAIAQLNTIIAANGGVGRVLFKHDEEFLATAQTAIKSTAGPVYIGKYSSAGPGTGASKPLLKATAGYANGSGVITVSSNLAAQVTMSGLILSDVKIDGSLNSNCYGFTTNGSCNDILAQNVTFSGIPNLCFNLSHTVINGANRTLNPKQPLWNRVCIVDCEQTDQRDNNFNTFAFLSCYRSYVAGNLMDADGSRAANATITHNLRMQWARMCTIHHNTMRHPGLNRHAMKIHSSEIVAWGSNPNNGAGAFTASATTNGGQGDYRRPYDPVGNLGGNPIILANTQPPIFRCTVGGTTGATEPLWNTTIGATTTDGAVTWLCIDPATAAPVDDCTWTNDSDGHGSRWIHAFGNKVLGKTTGAPIAIGPLNGSDYTRVRDWVIDSNYIDGNESGSVMAKPIQAWAQRGVIKNNIIDVTQATNVFGAITVGLRQYNGAGTETSTWAADDVRVFNNSIYCGSTATSSADAIKVDKYATSVTVQNNLFRTLQTGKTFTTLAGDYVGAQMTASNNTPTPAASSATEDCLFTVAPPTSVDDWGLQSGSPCRNTGVAVPVFRDFLGNLRTGAYDRGAMAA